VCCLCSPFGIITHSGKRIAYKEYVTMAFVPFYRHSCILVDNSKAALYQKAVKCLNKIAAMPIGSTFLAEINTSGHRVKIVPLSGGSGSSALELSGQAYVLMAQARKTRDATLMKNELTMAMGRSKLSAAALAAALATGMAPATYIAANNVGRPQQTVGPVNTYMGKIERLLHGELQADDVDLHIGLRRLLRAYLQQGRGSDCDVEINVDRPSQCWSDNSRHMRYPTICLAHELVHAWRFMTGRALAYFGEGTNDIEEVITTGLPPYNFEKYSENLFRSQWQGEELELRIAY
jgi:hypothetical protein